MTKSISIAMATYNGASFLEPLLDSLIQQNRLPDEVVISDDASRDATMDILADFKKRAPFPVHISRNDSATGVLENFYKCFGMATSDLIFYCDQDDIWDPNKLALVSKTFDDPNIHFATHRSLVSGDSPQAGTVIPFHRTYGSIRFPVDVLQVHSMGHQIAFDRDVLKIMEQLRWYGNDMAPDFANNFDAYIPFCASLIGDVALMEEPLVEFRRHAQTVSPAGKTAHIPSLFDRLVQTATDDVGRYSRRQELVRAAVRLGAISSVAGDTLLAAYATRVQTAKAIWDIPEGSLLGRPVRLVHAIRTSLRPDFKNKRSLRLIMHALAMTMHFRKAT